MLRIARGLLAAIIALFVTASLAVLGLGAWKFQASRRGTSAEYWEYLCGVQLPGFQGHHKYSYFGGTYPVIDDRAYYFAQTHHEQLLYWVPVDEVLQDASAVGQQLKDPQPPASSGCDEPRSVCDLYVQSAPRRTDCAGLLNAPSIAGASTLEQLRLTTASHARRGQSAERDAAFRGRIERGQRVWMTISFELLFLAAWLAFVAGVRPLRVAWPWRAGLGPFLLYLPFFAGYAPMTFTYGPSGGFVYPLYLMLAAVPMGLIPCSQADVFLESQIPLFLGWLSQTPGAPMAASHVACVGPASSLLFGACLIAVGAGFVAVRSRLRHSSNP